MRKFTAGCCELIIIGVKLCLVAFLVLNLPYLIFAEGWKQLQPNNAPGGKVEWQKFSWFSSNPACKNDDRVHIHIQNPGEKIYYGFNFSQVGYLYPLFLRILDPSGNVKHIDTIQYETSPGWIFNFTQAAAGPNIINPAGYDGFSWTPEGPGDYMMDMGSTNPIYSVQILSFDITVVDTTQNPFRAIDGRVFCKSWFIDCFGGGGFVGTLYSLPDDSIVTSVSFNGLANYYLYVTMTKNGIYPPPANWVDSRRSIPNGPGWYSNPDIRLFLNDPDTLVYPTGLLGEILTGSFLATPDCNGNVAITFQANKTGQVEIQIHIDPDPDFQPIDTVIFTTVNVGINSITWNGINGLGQTVENGTIFFVKANYLNGLVNLPMSTVPSSSQGFIVSLQRPTGPVPLMYWDDRLISPLNFNFMGCQSAMPSTGCHPWNSPPYGTANVLNTWWYTSSSSITSPLLTFKRSFQSVTDTTVCPGDTVIWRGQQYHVAGTYTQNYPSVLTGCDSTYILHLQNLPAPMVNLGPDTTACTGQTVIFDAGHCTGCTYQWANLTLGLMNIGTTQTYTASQSGLYMVTVTGPNGCNGRDTINLSIGPPVTVSVSVAASLNPVCEGTSVTFTAVPVNPGSSPIYLWKVNGVISGTNSPTYSYIPLNGDVVSCVLTSSITACVTGSPATSNIITMTVNAANPVGISIVASSNTVCEGTSVTFTATPAFPGSSPVYQWKVNGVNSGTNSSVFTYVPVNGEIVTCVLTSSLTTCVTGNPATSNPVIVTVNPLQPVSVNITTSANPVCAGTSVTFTASPVNPGSSPMYQWKLNGVSAGTNSTEFTYVPVNGDVVVCILTSSLTTCVTNNPATSAQYPVTVNSQLPVSVTITASANPVCSGSPVTFTANPTNPGSAPVYQWKVNGVNSGSNSNLFTYIPSNNDQVWCVLTSSEPCAINNPASSIQYPVSVHPLPSVSFPSCFDTITTVMAQAFKLKGGVPIGGTYSGPGVNSSTGYFTPSIAGAGVKTITYSYQNTYSCIDVRTRSIIVQAAPAFSCGQLLTDIRDGKTYPTVLLGTQCWMQKNLDHGIMTSAVNHQKDNCMAEKYCYNDDAANCSLFGGLYQWDELMQYQGTAGAQGACPPGWHVPTQGEWMTLFNFYQNQALAGKPLQDSIISGFRALESGVSYSNAAWKFKGFASIFWSSTPSGGFKAISHGMNLMNFSVSDYYSNRSNAFGVRCVRD